ncbi:MAG: hypothetical protein KAT65_27985, partial [Methanophagales archaeon]|nr:hypothetical protein [Methanophagales archaeon]
MRVGLLLILVKRVWVFVKRGKEPRDFTRNLFLERKALPKEHIRFSFSTGFLFVKKKKCCVIWWLIIFGMT